MAEFNPGIPQRRAALSVYTALLATATILLIAGSVWLSLKNQEATTLGNNPGGPFEYIAK